jgi:uncharacterized protein
MMDKSKLLQGLPGEDLVEAVSKLSREALAQTQAAAAKPLTVSIMGQTGVGKSSLLNALFGTNLPTSDDRPCTKDITPVPLEGIFKDRLLFYDLPGIGEAEEPDELYLEEYRQMLLTSDVAIWAIHVDNRSVTFDLQALEKIVAPFNEAVKGLLMSKITFVLTKADVISPDPWLLVKRGDEGIFGPQKKTLDLFKRKSVYYQNHFIKPYGHLLTSETHNDSNFAINTPPFFSSEYIVRYRGFMDVDTLSELEHQYPQHTAIIKRLYDNYQVIVCSAHFKYNLTKMMLVIINKLGKDAIARFSEFVKRASLNRMPFNQAKKYYNIVITDQNGRKILDLADQRL